MNSNYHSLSRKLCCFTLGDEEDEDVMDIKELVKGLKGRLFHEKHKSIKIFQEARQAHACGDKVLATSKLIIYNAMCERYKQLVGIYTKAELLKDQIDHSADLNSIVKSMSKSKPNVRLNVEKIESLMDEWEEIMTTNLEVTDAITPTEYDELIDVEIEHVEIEMPSVPTTKPTIKKKKKTAVLL